MAKLLHLQGIRGVAICSVIAFHFFPDYFPNGYLGVDLFFVLSGYLMSMMLSRHSNLTIPIVAEFLYRRIKRIIPLYYLVVMISTGIIYFCPCSEIVINLASSKRAISLMTNLYFNTGDDYFKKLGVAHDLFTHTWSLCLELQFYLIFPILWRAQAGLNPTRRMVLLHIISWSYIFCKTARSGGISLYFYFVNEEKEAFNKVTCRIWQFLFGNMIFCLEEYKLAPKGSEKAPLLEGKVEKECEKSDDWIFASLSLVLLAYSTVTEQHLTANYARMTTTVVSIILIYFGKGFPVLENRLVVFFGEISYTWYLIHWPLLVVFKIFEHTSILGILLSFTVAVIVHYALEKPYLGWGKAAISAVVVSLLLACLGTYFSLLQPYLEVCMENTVLKSHYANMTIEERKQYNDETNSKDQIQLIDKRCIYEQPRVLKDGYLLYGMEGTCKYENDSSNNNRTIAIIGNSWAANSSPLIFEECSPYFGQIYRASAGSCEVFKTKLSAENNCNSRQQMYYDLVERVKPDYLFIVVRYYFMMMTSTEQEWANIVEDGKETLSLLSNHVKRKIFILHTFPLITVRMNQLADAMEKGTPIDNEEKFDMLTVQRNLDKIVCPKCEQFDYTPQFMINGRFYKYDPEYFIAYQTHGAHFTEAGLERIRPIYTDICKKIGAQ